MAKKNKMIWIVAVVVVALVALGVLLWFLFGRGGGGNGANKQKMKDKLYKDGTYGHSGIDDGTQKKMASCFVDQLVDKIGIGDAKKIILDEDQETTVNYAEEEILINLRCIKKLGISAKGGNGQGGNGDNKKMKDKLISHGDGSVGDNLLASCFVDELSKKIGTANAKKIILDEDSATGTKYEVEMGAAESSCARKLGKAGITANL